MNLNLWDYAPDEQSGPHPLILGEFGVGCGNMSDCDCYCGIIEGGDRFVADKPFVVLFLNDGQWQTKQFDTEDAAQKFVENEWPNYQGLRFAKLYAHQGEKWVDLQQQKAPKDGVFTELAS